MASPKDIVDDGNQTIVASVAKTTVRGLNNFLCGKIPEWTKNRKNDKILVICGAHGNPDGSLAEEAPASGIEQMKQAWIKKNKVREDQLEVLDIMEYLEEGGEGSEIAKSKDTFENLEEKESLKVDELKFMAKVNDVKPGIITICVCHSHLSQIQFILDESAIVRGQKLERHLQLATRGRCIELDETQTQLLTTVAKPGNICKTTIIHGPEGSGKTFLALEVLKMKLFHQMRKLNLYGVKASNQKLIKVIICGSYSGMDRVPALLKQLHEEADDIREFCDVELKPVNDLEMRSPKEFQKKIKQTLGLGGKQTIVMMDELFPGFTTEEWKDFKGFEKTDFVLALRHAFNDGKCHGVFKKIFTKKKEFHSVMEEEGILEEEGIIVCHLRKSYRCTQKLITLAYYLLVHSPPADKLYETKSFIHLPNTVQEGETPVWLDVASVETFIEYSNNHPELKDDKDVLVIFDPNYDGHVIQTLRGHCIGRGWKSRPSSEVMGSEASIVIIYDLPMVHFESVSRAVNNLIFVTTTQNTR